MANEQDIIVRIKAEGSKEFIKALKKAGVSVEETERKAEKSSKKMSSSFKKIGAVIGAAFATQQIIQFTKQLAILAVDLDATEKKFKTVFGEASGIVERFAKRNATAIGLTTSEYKKAAAAAGDLLIPLGFQRAEAAKMSSELVNLSGALSAWTGGQLDAKAVSDILTKALLGEREQLKTLGIQISEADVKAKLLEKGQSKLTGTMLAQAKATATLELILGKSKDAQAAFADDTKTLAETSLELSANIKEIRDALATALIPVLGVAADRTIDLIDAFKRLRERLNDIGAKGGSDSAKAFRDTSDAVLELTGSSEKYLKAEKERIEALGIRAGLVKVSLNASKDTIRANEKERTRLEVINELLSTQGLTLEEVKDELNKLDPNIKSNGTRIQVLTKLWQDFNKATGEGGGDGTSIGILEGLKTKLKELNDELLKATTTEEIGNIQQSIKDVKSEMDIALISAIALDNALKELGKEDPFDNLDVDVAETVGLVLTNAAKAVEDEELDELLTAGMEESQKDWEAYLDTLVDDNLKSWAQMAKDQKESLAKQKEEREATIDSSIGISKKSFEVASAFINAEQQVLQNRFDQGLISEKQFQEERSKLMEKQAKANKANAIFEVGLNTASAITSALRAGPIIGPILAAVIGGLAAAQLAAVLKTPIPKFAKGTRKVGDGYELGEDRTLAWLNRGERVVTADDNKKHWGMLNAIEDGDKDAMMKALAGYGIAVQFDNNNSLLNQLDMPMRTLKEIKEGSKSGIDLNPLLNASDRQRVGLGRKLDKIHNAIVKQNGHRMTKA